MVNFLTLEDIYRKTGKSPSLLRWYMYDPKIDLVRDVIGVSPDTNIKNLDRIKYKLELQRKNTPFPSATKTENGVDYWAEEIVEIWMRNREIMALRAEV